MPKNGDFEKSPFLGIFGRKLVTVGEKWPKSGRLLGGFRLAQNGHFWVIFDQKWTFLAKNDHFWPKMAKKQCRGRSRLAHRVPQSSLGPALEGRPRSLGLGKFSRRIAKISRVWAEVVVANLQKETFGDLLPLSLAKWSLFGTFWLGRLRQKGRPFWWEPATVSSFLGASKLVF